jgi:predicted HD phosphohydrolase
VDHVKREGRRAESFHRQLLSLSEVFDGGEISELDHSLQTATRARSAGADDELILAALCHDVGKVFGNAGHGPIAAEFLRPHIRADLVEVVRHHGAFTARHWDPSLNGPGDPRNAFADRPWYPVAVTFVDDWDMESFDPQYENDSLESFGPLIQKLITGP